MRKGSTPEGGKKGSSHHRSPAPLPAWSRGPYQVRPHTRESGKIEAREAFLADTHPLLWLRIPGHWLTLERESPSPNTVGLPEPERRSHMGLSPGDRMKDCIRHIQNGSWPNKIPQFRRRCPEIMHLIHELFQRRQGF